MNETWKPVVGWEGQYEVSDLGRIRSLSRTFTNSVGQVRKIKGRIRCLQNNAGRKGIVIGKSRLVHHLVMESFVGPRPVNMEVLHLDDDPTNNRLENLKYGTHAENQGLMSTRKRAATGERHGRSKLKESQVIEILASGKITSELARAYGVSRATILYIRQKKKWKYLHEPIPQT